MRNNMKTTTTSPWLFYIPILFIASSILKGSSFVTTTTTTRQLLKDEDVSLRDNSNAMKPIVIASSSSSTLKLGLSMQQWHHSSKHDKRKRRAWPSPSILHSNKIKKLPATSSTDNNNSYNDDQSDNTTKKKLTPMQIVTRGTPLYTLLAAYIGLSFPPNLTSPLSSLLVTKTCLTLLMLSMGIAVTPTEMSRAISSPVLILVNALFCFVLMPFLATGIANGILPSEEGGTKVGLTLLGSVSGGQASNLFALLSGGDAALSVAFTLCTTLLGSIATPAIVGFLLGGSSIGVDVLGVLKSVISLALVPLMLGLSTSIVAPKFVEKRIRPLCPIVGIAATLCLVAGGAAGSSFLLLSGSGPSSSSTFQKLGFSILVSMFLPIVGGVASYIIAKPLLRLEERTTRTLVIETLSKSPTLAYVLARKHFGSGAAIVPAVSMVTLAVVGAVVASVWSMFPVSSAGSASMTADD